MAVIALPFALQSSQLTLECVVLDAVGVHDDGGRLDGTHDVFQREHMGKHRCGGPRRLGVLWTSRAGGSGEGLLGKLAWLETCCSEAQPPEMGAQGGGRMCVCARGGA